MLKIAALSDTHGDHRAVKFNENHLQADLLVFGGDFGHMHADEAYVKEFLSWFESQPQKHKILIGGNHDFFAEDNEEKFRSMLPSNIIYLNNEVVEIEGYKIFGSPNSPDLPMWAFSKMEKHMHEYYDLIPGDVQILITHTPPYGTLDMSSRGKICGSYTLEQKIKNLKLKAHIFGHIHHSSGMEEKDGVLYVNASVFNGEEPKYFEID